MGASIIGVRNKFKRAEDHLAELQGSIQRWGTAVAEREPFTIDHQFERKRVVIRHGKVSPNDPAWPLIVGDIIHNLRSALDHLVCQLAILNGNDVSCCDGTHFPICIHKSDFRKADKRLKKLISPEAFALIEDLQPYKAADEGKRPTAALLWAVHKLNIIDKHRTLLVVGKLFRATDLAYTLDGGTPTSIDIDKSWRPLEDGTEIASIDLSTVPFKAGAENKMRMQGGTEAQVFIYETGCGCDGQEVGKVMLACMGRVSEIIGQFESKCFPA